MARPPSTELTPAEQRIIDVLWERGESTVRDLTEALAEHQLAYTTVLTTVRIMSEKGYVTHRKAGRAHVYRAVVTRATARRRALGTLLDSLFDGSPVRLAQHLIEDDRLTLEDIESLRKQLADAAFDEGKDS